MPSPTVSSPSQTAPTVGKCINLAAYRDPFLNKSTAFTMAERDSLGIRALLPPRVETLDEQVARVYAQFTHYAELINRHAYLRSLQESNATLFYAFVLRHLKESLPVIYTPTVGEACLNFSNMFTSQLGGVYLTLADRGNVQKVLSNIHRDAIDVIVVTDGSRILGLGDLGANGMGIPVGKCSLYVAGGGIAPKRVLPVTLDFGTNTDSIREHPLYLGVREKRCSDADFYSLFDEFMEAATAQFPGVMIQFEDFSNNHCFDVLARYRDQYCCFNDDIQGTGAAIAAGVANAIRLAGTKAADQRIVVYGAGSAAVGVVDAIGRMLNKKHGLSAEDFKKLVYLVDTRGLVTTTRGDELAAHKVAYARTDVAAEENAKYKSIEATALAVHPTILIGLAGAGPAFTKAMVEDMCHHTERPIILPLSNPTSKSEISATEAYTWTDGKAIVASGSPFAAVEHNGKVYQASQGNNMYVFPGIGLGVTAARISTVTDDLLAVTALALADMVPTEELEAGLYPSLDRIREVSAVVATAVVQEAQRAGLVTKDGVPTEAAALRAYMDKAAWQAQYPSADAYMAWGCPV